jgi:hypothetical protein
MGRRDETARLGLPMAGGGLFLGHRLHRLILERVPWVGAFVGAQVGERQDKIADAWERQIGLPPNLNVQADKDTAPGQDRVGDGLTVFDEYRGLAVLDSKGAKVHRRFDPRVRELVVVDPENIFDADLWFKVSGVQVLKMDESIIAGGAGAEASRVVNFNTDDAGHYRYAVRVKTMTPAEDMEGERDSDPRLGLTPCGDCRSPKDADFAAVVPDRVRRVVEREYQNLIKATSDPASPQARLLAENNITIELPRPRSRFRPIPRGELQLLRPHQCRRLVTPPGPFLGYPKLPSRQWPFNGVSRRVEDRFALFVNDAGRRSLRGRCFLRSTRTPTSPTWPRASTFSN